jgi:acyl-CoA synthetase (NDP forming)
MLSSGKPLGVCVFGLSKTISTIKQNLNFPIFDAFEEMISALKKQSDYHARKGRKKEIAALPDHVDLETAGRWVNDHPGDSGEEVMALLSAFGITSLPSATATTAEEAADRADQIGYPVVLKVISPQALHKSEAGGVIVGVRDRGSVEKAFETIETNLRAYKKEALFQGVRVSAMAGEGTDMFIGGKIDRSFGPVVFFGYGGIYVEIFKDIQMLLCPVTREPIVEKIKRLKSYPILAGARGKAPANVNAYVQMIERVSHLLARFPRIQDLDLNPVRLRSDGSTVEVLDARIRIADGG